MFLGPKPAANSGFERQDITLKAVIIRCSISETPNCERFGCCLKTESKKAWKSLFNNDSALMAA